jgi:hypothetical protein
MGFSLEDIDRIYKVVEILRAKKEEEVQIWKDVGLFESIFPQNKSSVDLIRELRRAKL